MDFLGYRPATKRAQLGPFSGEAGFTSSAILRRRLHRILLTLSLGQVARLFSLLTCWGVVELKQVLRAVVARSVG
ncbi:hypothetical protein ALP10_200116 [Pseudomonas syringae pv. helianthi]|uniref:Uncharacterized protein n=1 Tax=Pseudomonas syringae pv. helianthi TaxID=251654 RepID=A0A3M6CWB4_9PSED|nr:hypothetical protein ALP10_200116 [Pseudomonas syringae pv. helianthi]